MTENIAEAYKIFKEGHDEFGDLLVIDKDAEILFKTDNISFDKSVCKIILDAWMEHQGSMIIDEIRYTILKSEPFQLAALKPGSGKSIVGSITKKGNYGIAFLTGGGANSLIVSSVLLNKWIWELI